MHSIPAAVDIIWLDIGLFKDQIAPTVEDPEGPDAVYALSPRIEYVIMPVSVGRERIGKEKVAIVAEYM